MVTANYVGQILAFAMLALSLNLLIGYAGIVSVAHAAFAGIGGYVFIGVMTANGLSFVPALIVGAVAAGVFGVIVGYAGLRLEPLWLILLTLAVQLNWGFLLTYFGKLLTLLRIPNEFGVGDASSLSVFGHPLSTPTQALPLLCVAGLLMFGLCHRLGESPFGRILRGIRDDEVATASLGKNVLFYKLSVFVITAAMAGVGGALLIVQTAVTDPNLFTFTVSVEIISMVVIGGRGNMFGSIIGAALIVLLMPFFQDVIKLSTSTAGFAQAITYGATLVAILYWRPQGILPEGTSPVQAVRGLVQRTAALAAFAQRTIGVDRHARTIAAAQGNASAIPSSMPSASVELAVAPVADRRSTPSTSDPRLEMIAKADGDDSDLVVQVRGLSKAFGGLRAVDGLNMDLRRGIITALVGPNGAGKTTVFNLLTGSLPLDAGRVYLHGDDVTGLRPDVITRHGMVRSFQDVRTFPFLSALDNVMLGVQHQPGEQLRNLFTRPRLTSRAERAARAHALDWLRFVEMDHLAKTLAGELSFGQQKILALVRILATDCDVLLLDEPCSGIDRVWIDAMSEAIRQIRDIGRTICIVEHNLEVVSQLADHVYFMELGRVTAEGSFTDLTSDRRLTEAYFGTV